MRRITSGSISFNDDYPPDIITNHIMITLYKQIETKGLYYKEMWYENADKVLIEHSGKVGYVGRNL